MVKRQARKVGRRYSDGRIVSVETAKKNPKTHQIEMMPLPGYGDTKRKN